MSVFPSPKMRMVGRSAHQGRGRGPGHVSDTKVTMLLMLMLALMLTAGKTLLLAGQPDSDTTMHDDEPGRGPIQLTRERATPLPLPLAYQSNGKYTESVEAGAEKVEDGHGRQPSELRTMRKALAVIGDPLPLDYLDGGVEDQKEEQDKEEQKVEEEAIQRPAAQGRKHRALRLADLGQPLPLKYNPAFNENWRAEQRLKTQTQVQAQTQIHHQSTRQAPAASVYDFGTPLPLPYADNDAIETEEYLRWKGLAEPGSFHEWKTEQEGRSRIPSGHSVRREGDTSQLQLVENVTSSISEARDARIQDTDPGEALPHDASSETPPAEEEEQGPMPEIIPKPEPEPEPEPETEMAVDHEIQHYIQHEDYRGLEERLGDAEFRLRLLRYTRRLKRQYDALCRALHVPAIDDDTTATNTVTSPGLVSAPRRAVVLQSAALSTGAFVLLCTICYFLAD